MKDWNAENPWFGTNRRQTALALGIAQELREGGDTSTGRVFYEKVRVEMEKELGGGKEPPVDKVEGGRHGSDGETRQSGRKNGFASLPADAKAACDADYRSNVKIKAKYPDITAWRNRYAELYNEQGS